ncbi:hypothetical protein PAT3040_00871 [Paenibacillus agaridevorans]|uniref:Uncharacterized protein n=1 Tax=Paenibacillus agaridevorans TaxID=171404 RepID=A0A2R5EIC1_9BACL|nr:hypothetical protein [Paenibacillus agaridevorans]GBG06346.1 hypothetical protein PAT3040_00871 [Paenibacillus agaridevorans]
MAEIKKKIEILADVDNLVEEIKECVIAISIMHGERQIDILKAVELWLGETITNFEKQQESLQEEPKIELAE